MGCNDEIIKDSILIIDGKIKAFGKEAKKEASRKKAQQKEMKKRGAKEVKRLAGSKVDLHMMRTTTGRQLVEVKSAPTGGIGTIEDDGITIDLGG